MVRNYLSLVKFGHTVFALPFALIGFVLGVRSDEAPLQIKSLVLVLLCMVFARSAAMAFNRYADREIDAENDRTRSREIPAGVISSGSALAFVVICSALFVICTYFINPLCFALSPVALAVILGYSYAKRFTSWSHFILGLGLALAPVGAYLAVTARFDLIPCLLGLIVLLWVGGFDIIYAMQDAEFDRKQNLHSIPASIGSSNALRLSAIVHLACAVLLVIVVFALLDSFPELGWLILVGAIVFLGMLWYQHRLVRPDDLSRVDLAFFTTNGIASLVFGAACILDFYV